MLLNDKEIRTLVVASEEVFLELTETIVKRILEQQKEKSLPEYISAAEAKKLLQVSDTTLWKMRSENLISYSQHKRKILYSRSSIISFLEKSKV